MELYNQIFHEGSLGLGSHNDDLERVGSAWGAFNRSRRYFKEQGLAGIRRLFISVPGLARAGDSLVNPAQAHALADILQSLCPFRAPSVDQVRGEDVMIITPYRAQRNLVKDVLDQEQLHYKAVSTIGAVQGQEAPVVFLLLTKPSMDPRASVSMPTPTN